MPSRASMQNFFSGLGAVSNTVLGYLQQKKAAEQQKQMQSAYLQAFQNPELSGVDPQLFYTLAGGNAPEALQAAMQQAQANRPKLHFTGGDYPTAVKYTPGGDILGTTDIKGDMPKIVELRKKYGATPQAWQLAIEMPETPAEDKAALQSALTNYLQQESKSRAEASALIEGRGVRAARSDALVKADIAGAENTALGQRISQLENEINRISTQGTYTEKKTIPTLQKELAAKKADHAKNLGTVNAYWSKYGYKWDAQGKLYKTIEGKQIEVDPNAVDLANPPHNYNPAKDTKRTGKSIGMIAPGIEILSIEDESA